jgi:hypothetical protein
MDDETDDGMDDGMDGWMDGWKASFRPRRLLLYVIRFKFNLSTLYMWFCHQTGRVNTTPRLLSWIHSIRMWMTPLVLSRQYYNSPIWSPQLLSFQLYWFPKRGTHQLILSPLQERPLIFPRNKGILGLLEPNVSRVWLEVRILNVHSVYDELLKPLTPFSFSTRVNEHKSFCYGITRINS